MATILKFIESIVLICLSQHLEYTTCSIFTHEVAIGVIRRILNAWNAPLPCIPCIQNYFM